MLEIISNFDYRFLVWLENNTKSLYLDTVIPAITFLGDHALVWIIIGLLLLFSKKYTKYGFILFLSLILGYLLGNGVLKILFARIRPFDMYNFGTLLISRPSGFSFPSDHALLSFASAFVLLKANKKFGIAAYILASILAFSRLYLFVHFLTDILGGIIIGTLCGYLSFYIFKISINL